MNEEKSNKPHCTTEAFIKNISDFFWTIVFIILNILFFEYG